MAPRRSSKATALSEALDGLDADALRELLMEAFSWLDRGNRDRLVAAAVEEADRVRAASIPVGPTDEAVAEILAFAQAAARVGYADPSDVDDYLTDGSNAFENKAYHDAAEIFRSLLIPINEVEIDLGQHEMLDEVLSVDLDTCAAQYVVSVYMTTPEWKRAAAVRDAIHEMSGVGSFMEPICEMESVAVEPLPNLETFVSAWRALIQDSLSRKDRRSDWDSDEDRWLREVIARTEGAAGLAAIARESKRAEDLRAWCESLVDVGDWKGALAAFDEASELADDKWDARGEFLDGAAHAAKKLKCKDVPERLERAWVQAPSMLRLRRWLGTSRSKKVLRERAAQALASCPEKDKRQRAFLHLLLQDFTSAAKRLSEAPGLGWTNREHPGHVVFPILCQLVGVSMPSEPEHDFDGLSSTFCLEMDARSLDELLRMAGVASPSDEKTRAAILDGMRKAAGRRLAGVVEHKRRRHYGHAASLALACAEADGSGSIWLEGIRAKYRRYPALQAELRRNVTRR